MNRRTFIASATAAAISCRRFVLALPCALLKAPVTPKHPERIVQLGRVRVDDYAWLKPANWKQVWQQPTMLSAEIRTYLGEENAYAEAVLAPTLPLQRSLFAEMSALTTVDEVAPPQPDGPWLYGSRPVPDGQQLVYYRQRRGGGEELLLDGEARAKGHTYLNLVQATHSPDHALFAWAEDTIGSERFRIFIKNIKTGEISPDPIENAFGGFVFSADAQWIYWIMRDDNSRPSKVYRRPARGGPGVLIYEEHDPGLLMALSRTASGSYVMIRCWNAETSEVRLIPADDPIAVPRVVEPRTAGLVYSVEHWNGQFVILTNADRAVDNKLMWATASDPSRKTWKEWVAAGTGRYITEMRPFRDFFVRVERFDANPHIIVTRADTMKEHAISFDEAAYSASLMEESEYDSPTLRYLYQSPREPTRWIDYDMKSSQQNDVKVQKHSFDKRDYVAERLFAAAADGAQVPITVLRKRETRLDGASPLLLYGYGSYGAFVEAAFSGANLALVNRGWIYAIAHVRGGSAKGWSWFLAARRLNKKRSFTDFICCAQVLIEKRYTRKERIVIHGFSAGGLLVGAANNMRPDLWAGVIGQAPFVDMLNTMSDATHPLVPLTRPDWGNPLDDRAAYDYIASYSPYDNVARCTYPAVLATTNIADDRVGFWEPAKWIAKLRASDLHGPPKLLRVEAEGGHGGETGKDKMLHQAALMYAFAIWAVNNRCRQRGAEEVKPPA